MSRIPSVPGRSWALLQWGCWGLSPPGTHRLRWPRRLGAAGYGSWGVMGRKKEKENPNPAVLMARNQMSFIVRARRELLRKRDKD